MSLCRISLLLCVVVFLAPVYGIAQVTGGLLPGQAPIRSGKVVILAVPDAKTPFDDAPVGGSGLKVAVTIRDALVPSGLSPFTSDHELLADGIKEARELGYDYVLKARIVEWLDYATAWSGRRDTVSISLELYDLSGKLISSATHRKQGSMWAVTDSTPDRLVPETLRLALLQLLTIPARR